MTLQSSKQLDYRVRLIKNHRPHHSGSLLYCDYCRQHYETYLDWAKHLSQIIEMNTIEWPAMYYVYGTYGYALEQTLARVARRKQKMYLYRAKVNGEMVWVSSWDPKPQMPSVEDKWAEWTSRLTKQILRKGGF